MVMAVILMSAMCFGQRWDKLNGHCKYIDAKMHDQDDNIIISSIIIYPFNYQGKYEIISHDDKKIIFHKNGLSEEYYINFSQLNKETINCRYNLSKKYIEFYPKEIKYEIPKTIYDNYMIGTRWINAGVAFMTIGIFTSIIGLCIMEDYTEASTTMCAIGGTCISIGIPLICFGDHIKRECNMTYELYNLTK